MKFFKDIKKKMETAHLANEVRREIEGIRTAINEVAGITGKDPKEMLDWPSRPYMLVTDEDEYVHTLNDDGYKNLMLFINNEDANVFAQRFEESTKRKCKVVQPKGLRPFKTDCVLTIGEAAFELWYGTYISHTILLEHNAMKDTGLI